MRIGNAYGSNSRYVFAICRFGAHPSASLLPVPPPERASCSAVSGGAPTLSVAISRHPLWTPSAERVERALITRFAREHGLPEDYEALWRWSVEHLEGFWALV